MRCFQTCFFAVLLGISSGAFAQAQGTEEWNAQGVEPMPIDTQDTAPTPNQPGYQVPVPLPAPVPEYAAEPVPAPAPRPAPTPVYQQPQTLPAPAPQPQARAAQPAPAEPAYQYQERGIISIIGDMNNFELSEKNRKFTGSLKGFSLQYKSKGDGFRARFTRMSGDDLDSKVGGFKQSGESFEYTDFAFAGGNEGNFGGKSGMFVAPYVGLGYRTMEDSKDRETDIKRTFNNFYILIAADWRVKPGNGWIVSANTELDVLAWGRSKNYGGTMSGSYTPGYGYGYNFGLKVEKDFGAVLLFIEPYYHYWKQGDSEKKSYSGWSNNKFSTWKEYNPGHEINETGIRIGVGF